MLRELEGGRFRGRFGAALDGRFGAGTALLAVGEPGSGRSAQGRVNVFRGVELKPAFRIEGDEKTRGLGSSFVSIVGDVNGDGVGDVYASDWKSSARGDRTGVVLVHCGVTGSRLLTLYGENDHDGFGTGDGRVGDVDGDGCDDLLVGAWLSRDAADKGGKVVLFSGRTGHEIRRWTGDETGASLGFDAAGLGDVDGDGQLDYLFSAALSDRRTPHGHAVDAGVVFLVSGEVCEPGEHLAPEPIDLPTMEEAFALFRSRDYAAAAHAYDRIATARPEEMRAWVQLGLSLHAEGRYEEALTAHLRAARFPEVAVRATYNAACAHALLGNRDQAFDLLGRAIEHGFSDLRHIEADADLNSLRDDPRWNDILPEPDGVGTFLEPGAIVLHEILGEAPGAHFGWALAAPGDLDGDGVDDLFVSAPYHADEDVSGRVDLISGRTGRARLPAERHALQRLRQGPGRALRPHGRRAARARHRGAGAARRDRPGPRAVGRGRRRAFVAEGPGSGDQFGRCVVALGDLDGDGVDDLAVGASEFTTLDPEVSGEERIDGVVVLLSGRDGRELGRLACEGHGERFGSALASRFDAEERVLAVGARDGGARQQGRVYVYRDRLDTPAFVIDGGEENVDLGQVHVSLLDDRDGDGLSELLLGDWRHGGARPHVGQLRVVSGADGAEHFQLLGRSRGEASASASCRPATSTGTGRPISWPGPGSATRAPSRVARSTRSRALRGASSRPGRAPCPRPLRDGDGRDRRRERRRGARRGRRRDVPTAGPRSPPAASSSWSGAAARGLDARRPEAAFGPGDDQDR